MSISVKRLAEFCYSYIETYQKLVSDLSQPVQKLVRDIPPCLLSQKIVIYLLTNAVIICDEITTPLLPSLPFHTFEKRAGKVNQSQIEVRKINASSGEFTRFLTLGAIQFTCEERASYFGKRGGITGGTFIAGSQKRDVGDTLLFGYLDESGWDQRWAWLVAQETLQKDVDSAFFRLMFKSGLASEEEIKQLGQREAALIGLKRFRMSVAQFEKFLEMYANQENKFQGLFETYPYLLSMWGKVTPKPFLNCQGSVNSINTSRVPDFLIRELDGSCTLVEIESPIKPIFTEGNNPRQTQYVTQAENQVRQWDQIIRTNSAMVTLYPGIEYYKARVVIGRSYHPAFPSFAAFQSQLASLNEQKSHTRFETYDVLLEQARTALDFLELIFSGVPIQSMQ